MGDVDREEATTADIERRVPLLDEGMGRPRLSAQLYSLRAVVVAV